MSLGVGGTDSVHVARHDDEIGEAGEYAVTVRDLSFQYESGLHVLDGLSYDFRQGSTVGIVGPSGCGKSTLLALVAGLLQPTAGGIHRTSFSRERHLLSVVFQRDTLLPWLTTLDNVNLYARFKSVDRRLRDERARQLIGLAGLEGFERAYPYQLSGGMRRRVAFLAGVAPSPQILLLDEPFSSLDEPTRVAIHQDVLRIIQQSKMTVVLVTHDLAEALSLCDEVAIFTRRPAKVFSRHTVPFGHDRNVLELRQSAEFLELYGRLWHDLSLQLKAPEGRSHGA